MDDKDNFKTDIQTILICDDSYAIRRAINLHLSHAGFNVIETSTSSETLKYIDKFPVELILLDGKLHHEDGSELLIHIKRNPKTSKIPVILISSISDRSFIMKCLDAGAEDYIVKPFSGQEIVKRIKQIVG